MTLKNLFVLLFVLFTLSASTTHASNKEFYLLTCDPGKEVYSLFGHSAIRMIDTDKRMDVVFNYGIFSFEAENFIWNFARGYTDYLLDVQSYKSFHRQYEYEKRTVIQNRINLSAEEADQLYYLLRENLKPSNRVYRYNYFTNNCASKIRDIVVEAKQAPATYSNNHQLTYRQAVKTYMQPFPWTKLGTDLLLGAPADTLITDSALMFLPDYLQKGLVETTIKDAPLLLGSETIVKGAPRKTFQLGIFHPLIVFGLLFAITLYLTFLETKQKINLRIFDALLYIILGLGGFLVGFISFVSVHPTVFPNVHILWFFPFHLIAGILLFRKKRPDWISRYIQFSGWASILVLLIWVIGLQKATVSLLPLLLVFMLRSNIGYLISTNKRKNV